jgi:hypothetical protein
VDAVRFLRWRALWVAGAVSVLALATAGVLAGAAGQRTEPGAPGVHRVVADHDAVVPARLVAERPPFDVRSLPTKLLLLAWLGALLAATLLATDGRALRLRTRRAASPVAARARLDRGPPVSSFA